MTEPRILLIEDSLALRTLASAFLEKQAYRVETVGTRIGALRMLDLFDPHVAILDLGLDDGDGSDLISTIAQRNVPLIVTSSRSATQDRIEALDLGADDYLVKPVDLRELLARVRRLSSREKRPGAKPEPSVHRRLGASTIDVANRVLISSGRLNIALTTSEFRLLYVFLGKPGEVLERHVIGRSLAGQSGDQSRAVDVMVSRLRRKIEALGDGHTIRTVRGYGYLLVPDEATAEAPARALRS